MKTLATYHNNLISGFALDVFENEPIKSEFYKKISSDMNCILTPHISGVTTESNIRVSDFIVKKSHYGVYFQSGVNVMDENDYHTIVRSSNY